MKEISHDTCPYSKVESHVTATINLKQEKHKNPLTTKHKPVDIYARHYNISLKRNRFASRASDGNFRSTDRRRQNILNRRTKRDTFSPRRTTANAVSSNYSLWCSRQNRLRRLSLLFNALRDSSSSIVSRSLSFFHAVCHFRNGQSRHSLQIEKLSSNHSYGSTTVDNVYNRLDSRSIIDYAPSKRLGKMHAIGHCQSTRDVIGYAVDYNWIMGQNIHSVRIICFEILENLQ